MRVRCEVDGGEEIAELADVGEMRVLDHAHDRLLLPARVLDHVEKAGALARVGERPVERLAPAEGRAWIGLLFTVLVAAYLLAKHEFIARAGDYRELGPIGTNVVLLLVVWAVIAQVMRWRWKERVQEDERDRQIERHAADWGHGALVFCVIGLAAMLALSPQSRLAWATPIVTAHLLVFALLWGSIVEHAASAIAYWRDRRA